ncbi:LemA family protein [Candidatus Jidaibacter acanthamoeba]|uniref:LemA family protein n=1 Tax=Candidatus Jidaibacter acanthamoebae TaxID=86105 RepID=A0A0C1QMS8_9RICK|nr:LemA family protein [Candidatus Jidaibacter acanthamoeba]KIE05353.1 LemA family protein [Candidatus Jidaibacter acanthamoeba]
MDSIILGIIGVVLIISYLWYASLILKRNNVRGSLSGIDVQLKKRSDLIPNILAVAKKFMQHEMEIMKEITGLRTQVDKKYDPNNITEVKNHFADSELLANKLGQFMMSVENYPDLKSNQAMIEVIQSLNEVEAQLTAARRFYNSTVTALNNTIQIFPGNLIAKLANIQELPFYQTDEASKAPINTSEFLS